MASVHRNSPCPCGSGRKFKNCCQRQPDATPSPDRRVVDNNALAEAVALHNAGHLQQAESIYRQILAIVPEQPDALHLLGLIADQVGRPADAVSLIRKAIGIAPTAVMHCNLANALAHLDRFDEAIAGYRRAIALQPRFDLAHQNLARMLHALGRFDDAETTYRAALESCPHVADLHFGLGNVLRDTKSYDAALHEYREALRIAPGHAESWTNIGSTLMDMGRLDEAVAAYRSALGIRPNYAQAHQNLLLAMQYAPTASPQQIKIEHDRFAGRFARPLRSEWPDHRNASDPDRRLKVGFVSGDLRRHAVASFLEPILANRDCEQFEVYCYYTAPERDDHSVRFVAASDHWVDCANLTDPQLSARIQRDAIDLLVDLSGHSAHNRALVFARKPAPIQVSWLGYPSTTGLEAIDYRITDRFAEPPGLAEHLYVESLWRLPDGFCCYQADVARPPVVGRPPFDGNGVVTFGCFNNFAKVTDPVLALWAEILDRVPGSRLLLEIAGIDSPGFLADTERRLHACGFARDHVLLEARKPENRFALYNRIDLALDPFPCNGGTTSLDTLWMGVPFVTLAGAHFISRMGVSILSNAGLTDLIASDATEYVDLAVGLANDRERLWRLRDGLREKIEASPLMDAPRFTRNLEAAWRAMWRTWCASAGTRRDA